MEETALLQVAAEMCAAARTAPKATGRDTIYTLVLTGEEKDQLAQKMDEIGERDFSDKGFSWYKRDAVNLRNAQAVALIGAKRATRGVGNCGYCGFGNCAGCKKAGGTCAFVTLDLGIALAIHDHVWREQPSDPFSRAIPVQGGISIGNKFDIELSGGAGCSGDYLYRSGSFAWDVESGMWGIFRVMKQTFVRKCKGVCSRIWEGLR